MNPALLFSRLGRGTLGALQIPVDPVEDVERRALVAGRDSLVGYAGELDAAIESGRDAFEQELEERTGSDVLDDHASGFCAGFDAAFAADLLVLLRRGRKGGREGYP